MRWLCYQWRAPAACRADSTAAAETYSGCYLNRQKAVQLLEPEPYMKCKIALSGLGIAEKPGNTNARQSTDDAP